MNQVMFVELGMGVDLQGQDTTKAAVRAVRDAIGRNYLPGMRALTDGKTRRMTVRVRLAVPADSAAPDLDSVRSALPHGEVSLEVVPGGMLAPNGYSDGGKICIVNAAIEIGIAS